MGLLVTIHKRLQNKMALWVLWGRANIMINKNNPESELISLKTNSFQNVGYNYIAMQYINPITIIILIIET